MRKAPPAPVAIFSKDYFTEVEAWLTAKAKALEDFEKYSKGEFEITCNHLAADTLSIVLTGEQPTSRSAGTLDHLMDHVHPQGATNNLDHPVVHAHPAADTISDDNHQPPPTTT